MGSGEWGVGSGGQEDKGTRGQKGQGDKENNSFPPSPPLPLPDSLLPTPYSLL
ncbi:hypothetical protein [Tolypothrix sp. VBCCA 56010]|uniref:hypothetical protein n=1 Tax=Tolypothrix sp. VBCCA 56010 TaxID=3137731 RepID=UPI003D7CDCB6